MSIKGFVIPYTVLVVLDQLAAIYYPGARLITKPLILASLLIWYVGTVKDRQRPAVLLALIFSLFGDILLLFGGEVFFMAGLASFLLAQLSYYFYFRKFGNLNSKKDKVKSILILTTAAIFYSVLFSHLGLLKFPVLLYTLAISLMVISANVQKLSPLIAIGSLLFMISDMSLGLQKFVLSGGGLEILIMLTYAGAQYFIVKGIIDGQTKA